MRHPARPHSSLTPICCDSRRAAAPGARSILPPAATLRWPLRAAQLERQVDHLHLGERMNPAMRRRQLWCAVLLVAVAASSMLMPDPADYLLGVLGGVAVTLLVLFLTGAFRSSPKD